MHKNYDPQLLLLGVVARITELKHELNQLTVLHSKITKQLGLSAHTGSLVKTEQRRKTKAKTKKMLHWTQQPENKEKLLRIRRKAAKKKAAHASHKVHWTKRPENHKRVMERIKKMVNAKHHNSVLNFE